MDTIVMYGNCKILSRIQQPYTLLDPAGTEGFPGTVSTTVSYLISDPFKIWSIMLGKVTYTLERNATWNININAIPSTETPTLLELWSIPRISRSRCSLCSIPCLQVCGYRRQINSNWWTPRCWQYSDGLSKSKIYQFKYFRNYSGRILRHWWAMSDNFGLFKDTSHLELHPGCIGFDNCWLFDEMKDQKPAFSMWSTNSGIKLVKPLLSWLLEMKQVNADLIYSLISLLCR